MRATPVVIVSFALGAVTGAGCYHLFAGCPAAPDRMRIVEIPAPTDNKPPSPRPAPTFPQVPQTKSAAPIDVTRGPMEREQEARIRNLENQRLIDAETKSP